MRHSDTIAELAAALVNAQAAMPNVPKETQGQVGNQIRKYADLATVTETVRPILHKHGLGYVQGVCDGLDGGVTVTTRLLHKSGEWLEDSLSMPTGNTAQGVGSAITYGRRYALMAMLGLAPEDDDGATATHERETGRAAAPVDTANMAAATELYAHLLRLKGTPEAEAVKALAAREGQGLREVDLRDPVWRARIATALDDLEPADTLPLGAS